MSALSRAAREPLVRFLIIGLALFGMHHVFNPSTAREPDGREVFIDRAALLRYVQIRSRSFDEAAASAYLESMSPGERRALIRDLFREEALYREALSWGLGEDDYVIRRRLVQSLEFATRGAVAAEQDIGEAELRAYYEEHKADYERPPTVTFTHVFFNAERHGWETARQQAQEVLGAIDEGGMETLPGDRFLYHLNYIDETRDLVADHFGAAMAKRVFALAPDAGRWQGPFQSAYGMHLVRLTERTAGGVPPFEEIRALIARDAAQARIDRRQEAIHGKILSDYRLRLADDLARDDG